MAKKKTVKKKTATKKAAPKKSVKFETSLEALRDVLQQLEEGNLPLSDSLAKYESGIKHLRNCHDALKQAKARIELLVNIDESGKAVTQPFDHSATHTEPLQSVSAEVQNELDAELAEELEDSQADDEDWDGGLF